MTQTAIRPVTLCRSEQAENGNLAWQQIDVLNSKLALKTQPRSLISYTIDARLNVIRLQFPLLSKRGTE